jgi:hypothetical protein
LEIRINDYIHSIRKSKNPFEDEIKTEEDIRKQEKIEEELNQNEK